MNYKLLQSIIDKMISQIGEILTSNGYEIIVFKYDRYVMEGEYSSTIRSPEHQSVCELFIEEPATGHTMIGLIHNFKHLSIFSKNPNYNKTLNQIDTLLHLWGIAPRDGSIVYTSLSLNELVGIFQDDLDVVVELF
jgi:hypothetical protein